MAVHDLVGVQEVKEVPQSIGCTEVELQHWGLAHETVLGVINAEAPHAGKSNCGGQDA